MDYYRIHRANESIETILDPSRRDGWVASDEDGDDYVQPHGVSACATLEHLARYIRHYSMSLREGDRLVRISGRLSYDQDRDDWACRVIAESVEIIGDALAWKAAGYPETV